MEIFNFVWKLDDSFLFKKLYLFKQYLEFDFSFTTGINNVNEREMNVIDGNNGQLATALF